MLAPHLTELKFHFWLCSMWELDEHGVMVRKSIC